MKYIIAFVVILVSAGFAYQIFFQDTRQSTAAVCDRNALGLADDTPIAFTATLDIGCAATLINETDAGRAEVAMNFGYPSIMFDGEVHASLTNLVSDVVAEGDRGFFAYDPEILDAVSYMKDDPALAPNYTFIQSIFDPDAAFADTADAWAVMKATPIWNAPENMQRIETWCASEGCADDVTACPNTFGLADKEKLASGTLDLREAVALCPISFEWISELREAGVIDTSCSSSLQVNLGMEQPETLLIGCFPESLSLRDYPAFGATDTVRFLRFQNEMDKLDALTAEDLEIIAQQFPNIAAYLQRRQTNQ